MMTRLRKIFLLSTIVVIGIFASSLFVSFADSSSINFEAPTYTVGSIHLQDGWSSAGSAGLGCGLYDHAVVSNGPSAPASFGAQSLRISNAVTTGCFGDQTFSKSLTNESGETSAVSGGMSGGVRQKHYESQFSLASTIPYAQQADLYMSVSPDRGDGARMSYLRFEDQADGIHVYFDDFKDVAPFGTAVYPWTPSTPNPGCDVGDDFVETDIATLDRSVPHTFKFVMDFVDGPRNDVVKVYIDGVLKITGTSWEDYFRFCEGNPTRPVDSLLFRTGGGSNYPANLGNGFLIDGVNSATSTQPANANACKNGGWANYSRPDGSTFKNQGDCIQYVNTGR